jgi:hypothetical protein
MDMEGGNKFNVLVPTVSSSDSWKLNKSEAVLNGIPVCPLTEI